MTFDPQWGATSRRAPTMPPACVRERFLFALSYYYPFTPHPRIFSLTRTRSGDVGAASAGHSPCGSIGSIVQGRSV